jgi:hypothetical protein
MWPGFVEWARMAMLGFETPLASPGDFNIPVCVPTGDEAISLIRIHHDQWSRKTARAEAQHA